MTSLIFEIGVSDGMEKLALKASTIASAAAKRGVSENHLKAEILNRVTERHRKDGGTMYEYLKRRMARTGYQPGAGRPTPMSSPLAKHVPTQEQARVMNNRYTRSWSGFKPPPRNGLVELPGKPLVYK